MSPLVDDAPAPPATPRAPAPPLDFKPVRVLRLGGAASLGSLLKTELPALFLHPAFLCVLALKLALGTVCASAYLRDLFTPFVSYFVESGGSNPWAFFYARGESNAFPYSPVMLVVFALPRLLFDGLLSSGWETVSAGHLLVMRIPLLAADVLVYLTLAAFLPHRIARVRALYWCSPIVIYATYWHGQLDLVPTALLFAGVYCALHRRVIAGGVIVGLALATKSHVLVALPFLALFLVRRRDWGAALRFVGMALVVGVGCIAPCLASSAYRTMVLASPEQSLVFELALRLGAATEVYVTPAVLLVLVIAFATYPKKNADLLLLFLGLSFCSFVLLVPPRPGWYLWTLPLLAYAFAKSGRHQVATYHGFAVAYVAYFLFGPTGDYADALGLWNPTLRTDLTAGVASQVEIDRGGSLAFTVMQSLLLVNLGLVWRFGVRSNEVYKLSLRPTMIGIAGDSGSGKDTLAQLLAELLGREQVTHVSGDDYHRWPRGHENWQRYTHLDLRSNSLAQLAHDSDALRSRASIEQAHYDHGTGQFRPKHTVTPANFVLCAGLHTFVIERMRALLDLKIFMDPCESLRRQWKIERDHRERNKSPESVIASLAARSDDRARHVLPQREFADLVVRFLPAKEGEILAGAPPSAIELELVARNSFHLELFALALSDRTRLVVHDHPQGDLTFHAVRLSGEVARGELLAVALEIVPNLDELSDGQPIEFRDGLNGVLQLACLYCLSWAMQWQRAPELRAPQLALS
ncbi:MAG: glycosyltransferase 87 family protein [Planctomycetota bacterium]